MGRKTRPPSWWKTVPGILTGLAALITAVTGAVIGFRQLDRKAEPPEVSPAAIARSPAAPPRDGNASAIADGPGNTAKAFLTAWGSGDRTSALAVAPASIVDKIFGATRPNLDAGDPVCYVVGSGQRDCSFSHANGTVVIRLRETDHGWRVERVDY